MTSLSSYAISKQPLMYAAPPPPLARTTSQPYVARWVSTSPTTGSSAFGSPTRENGYYSYSYGQGQDPGAPTDPGHVQGSNSYGPGGYRRESKSTGLTYPILTLPVGTRKKKVWQKVTQPDGTEEDVLVDGDEEEEVYEKRKRLFYFDR